MFGKIVMDVPADAFEEALDARRRRKGGAPRTPTSTPTTWRRWSTEFLGIYREAHRAASSRTDPREQLRLAIEAVFRAGTAGARSDYRRQNKISDDLGTAVNVQSMVFGNRGDDSGTGRGVHARPHAPARRSRTATTWRTRRARTSWRASATRCRSRSSRRSIRRRTRGSAR